jgi:iron complex transport system permease protein
MKVTLDLSKLLQDGKITQAEFDKLSMLAAEGTGSLAFNILIGFGVIAVAGASIALAATPATAIDIGVLVAGAGLAIVFARFPQWEMLGNICVLAGALMFAGGVIWLGQGSVLSFLVVTAVFVAAGIAARSGLLIAAAVLALSSCVGARTGYMHATYFLGIQEPAITTILFALMALAAYQASLRLPAAYENLALMAARTSLFLVNFGFWIGSLWGDRMNWLRGSAMRDVVISRDIFALTWAVALIATGIWAVRANRRWVVTIVAIFGAIHFYTQWFERLGATPFSVLIAGLITLAAAFGLWTFTRSGRAGA